MMSISEAVLSSLCIGGRVRYSGSSLTEQLLYRKLKGWERSKEMKARAKEIQDSRSLKKFNSISDLENFFSKMRRYNEYDRVSSISAHPLELGDSDKVEFLTIILPSCNNLNYLKIPCIDVIKDKKYIDILIDSIRRCKSLKTIVIGGIGGVSKVDETKRLIEEMGKVCEIK